MIANKNGLKRMKLLPAGNGWNVECRRTHREPYKYYGISRSSVQRISNVINDAYEKGKGWTKQYDSVYVELGYTGWAEIEIYPKPENIFFNRKEENNGT